MFMILDKFHHDINEPLDADEIDAVVTRLLEGQLDYASDEYKALRYSLSDMYLQADEESSTESSPVERAMNSFLASFTHSTVRQ